MARNSMGKVNYDYAMKLATTPAEEDGPIWMVNYMRYKPKAVDADGTEAAISGQEADDIYNPSDVLARFGAKVAFFGNVIDEEGGWHRMGIVLYPTRKSFIEMQERPDFKEKVVHKEAGMEFTVLPCCLPLRPYVGEPDGSRVARFTVYPAGSPEPVVSEGAVFRVEDTIIGDERQWEYLVVSFEDRVDELPDGAMGVRTTIQVNNILPLLSELI
ncbi:MAG: hypothetical protein WCG86_08405 [Actinomycetota bacterium]